MAVGEARFDRRDIDAQRGETGEPRFRVRRPGLTVAALDARAFEIMVIPHTLERTTLGGLRAGRRVNLEMDVIGKYVLRALSLKA